MPKKSVVSKSKKRRASSRGTRKNSALKALPPDAQTAVLLLAYAMNHKYKVTFLHEVDPVRRVPPNGFQVAVGGEVIIIRMESGE